MRKLAFFLPLIVFGMLAVLFVYVLRTTKDATVMPSMLIGKSAPVIDLPAALPGKKGVTSAMLGYGRPALVHFFASWCLSCVAEQEELLQLVRREHAVIYGIAYKDKKDVLKKWIGVHGDPFVAVGLDADGSTAIDWGVYGVPETFLVDGEGVIRARQVGAMTEEVYHQMMGVLKR